MYTARTTSSKLFQKCRRKMECKKGRYTTRFSLATWFSKVMTSTRGGSWLHWFHRSVSPDRRPSEVSRLMACSSTRTAKSSQSQFLVPLSSSSTRQIWSMVQWNLTVRGSTAMVWTPFALGLSPKIPIRIHLLNVMTLKLWTKRWS